MTDSAAAVPRPYALLLDGGERITATAVSAIGGPGRYTRDSRRVGSHTLLLPTFLNRSQRAEAATSSTEGTEGTSQMKRYALSEPPPHRSCAAQRSWALRRCDAPERLNRPGSGSAARSRHAGTDLQAVALARLAVLDLVLAAFVGRAG